LELFRGLAQRNKGRKTSYLDGLPASKWEGKTPQWPDGAKAPALVMTPSPSGIQP